MTPIAARLAFLGLALLAASPTAAEPYEPRVCYGEWHCAKRLNVLLEDWHARTSGHPLAGRVYATGGWDALSLAPAADGTANLGAVMTGLLALRQKQAAKEGLVVVLGEAHDNPDHHAARALFLNFIGRDANTKWGIAAEQFRADEQTKLDSLPSSASRQISLDAFKAAVGWEKSGWNKYAYDPLWDAVLAQGLKLYAGDPPKDTIRKIAKEGLASLDEVERLRLKLDVPLAGSLEAASRAEIEDSHCGMLPEAAIPNMALAQRYRDATLADATLRAVEAHGAAILLTGNVHARTDRGVPWAIRQRVPGMGIVSVMFVEVEDGKTGPEAYVPRDPEGKPAADLVVFTPPAKRSDPCDAFKAPPAPAN